MILWTCWMLFLVSLFTGARMSSSRFGVVLGWHEAERAPDDGEERCGQEGGLFVAVRDAEDGGADEGGGDETETAHGS